MICTTDIKISRKLPWLSPGLDWPNFYPKDKKDCVTVVQSLSHVQLCKPMDCSTPGFSVWHHLLEFTQTHVHWFGDVIQPSQPLLPPSPPAFNLSQHQGFFPKSQIFTSGGQSIETSASASVLPMNIQVWFPLGLTGLISLLSKGLSRVVSSTTVWKHQFFGTQAFYMVQLLYLFVTTGKP